MSSRSLLMVLLVLVCLQSFTTAQNADLSGPCCFTFQRNKLPLRLITNYKETERGCIKPGIIFIMESGRRVCVDPGVHWVKGHIATIDQRTSAETVPPKMMEGN